MPMSGYDSAFEQATGERSDIRVQIERLLTRGEQLDKLLECLAPFITTHKDEPMHSQEPPAHAGQIEEHPQHQEQNEHHEYHQG